jgi:hypothetical protein
MRYFVLLTLFACSKAADSDSDAAGDSDVAEAADSDAADSDTDAE